MSKHSSRSECRDGYLSTSENHRAQTTNYLNVSKRLCQIVRRPFLARLKSVVGITTFVDKKQQSFQQHFIHYKTLEWVPAFIKE